MFILLKCIHKNILLLVVVALTLNIFFLCLHIKLQSYRHHSSYGLLHPNLAYNLCKYGECKLDANVHDYLITQAQEYGGMLSLAEVEQTIIRSSQDFPFPINDTIGYGLIFALLWKLTSSFTFLDIQLLQVLIFSLLMALHYRIAYMLFASKRVALYAGIAHLLFFPIVAMNIHAVRDIWAYYGLVVLLYYCATFFTQGFQLRHMVYGGFWLAFFQCIRPTLFAAIIMCTMFFLGYALFSIETRKKFSMVFCCCIARTLVFFGYLL